MKTTARQFFDIWCECVVGVKYALSVSVGATLHKRITIQVIRARHGDSPAIEAECYFERLKADTQAGISSL